MVARTNPARGPAGIGKGIQGTACHPEWMPLVALSNTGWAPCGICTGDHGASWACPYGARSNPGARPVKFRDRPRTGMPGQIPFEPRAGFVRVTMGHHGDVRTGPAQNPGARPVKSCDRPCTGFDRAL